MIFKKILLQTSWFALAYFLTTGLAYSAVKQTPLYLSYSADPNVLINLSVETPMGGAAYNDQPSTLAGGTSCPGRRDSSGKIVTEADKDLDNGLYGTCYFTTEEYLGYFDSNFCYNYDSTNHYFYAVEATNADYSCTGKTARYSGNFLNWASMTATDIFVGTMTGGNRVTDTTSSTIIKGAKAEPSSYRWFPYKWLNSSYNVAPSTVTPWSDTSIYIVRDDDNIYFDTSAGGSGKKAGKLQVKVCSSSALLESNCQEYNSGGLTYYKPEGLMQKHSDSMRFALTSYLQNPSGGTDYARGGGVLRSNMKYVGTTRPDGNGGFETNPNAEVSSLGLLNTNPDPTDATNSGVSNSGIINYLNKFSDYGYKNRDPIAELYYESIRYFKKLGPTPEYSSGLTTAEKGGFPVLDSAGEWDDPIQYSCQKNFIIGVNDANPWYDKKLPGTHFTTQSFGGQNFDTASEDWDQPGDADGDINVTLLTNKVGELQGINGTSRCIGCTSSSCNMTAAGNTNKTITNLGEVSGTCPDTQKQNSYYIAGLAYYANTSDLRPTKFPDTKTTITTLMIDTQEYKTDPLLGEMNMLWLAAKYGGFIDSNNNSEPDLLSEWDEDGDGEPDNYVLASQPQNLINALNASFDEIDERTSTSSAVITNSTRLEAGVNAYQAKFSSSSWTGHFYSLPIDAETGELKSAVWDASEQLPAHGSRSIFTWDVTNSVGISFDQTNQALIAAGNSALTTNMINYLRGDSSKELRNTGGLYRDRVATVDGESTDNVLGDIINSDPVYVSDENYGYENVGGSMGSDYATFRSSSSYTSRLDMVYVGANDGMLHAFNATTGEEVFAYIPKSVHSKLDDLASPNYEHKYYVDGPLHVADAYLDLTDDGEINPVWRTILVGTTAGGGPGVFALDITDPENFSEANVLWDISSADLSDLGYTYGQPNIVLLNDGSWAAVVANGYESSAGKAKFYLLNLATGAELASFDTKVSSTTSPKNGLSTVLAIDHDGNKTADYLYAGDLFGNLWKVDISSSNTSQWKFSHKSGGNPEPLFVATSNGTTTQPIMGALQAKKFTQSTSGDFLIYFGTGKYFETNDNVVGSSPQLQTFYAIRDVSGDKVLQDKSELLEQKILVETDISSTDFRGRVTSSYSDSSKNKGWYMNLIVDGASSGAGERVITKPILRGERVIFTTLIPSSDPCDPGGGSSWLMELHSDDGSLLDYPVFDVSDDDMFNQADQVYVDIDGDGVYEYVNLGGVQVKDIGITKAPPILDTPDNELKIISGSSGNTKSLGEAGSGTGGRQAWQQLR